MYEVKASKDYPGFYYIVSVNHPWSDDQYLHKNGEIHYGYGRVNRPPEEMLGLWDDPGKADQFCKSFNRKEKEKTGLFAALARNIDLLCMENK